MGEITEKRRRDYSGLDADKASIPAVGKAVNDTFLATDTKILYFWDGVAWIIIPLDVITAGMLKTDAVETAKIKDLNVTVGKLAGGITATKLAANCVETAKIKDLNVTKGKAELGFGRYVPRTVAAADFGVGNFTTDGTWKVDGLDLSAIVPAGAVAVNLRTILLDDAADSQFFIRRNATDAGNALATFTQVANIDIDQNAIIAVDSNRLLDYLGSNLVFTKIDIVVIGWFI